MLVRLKKYARERFRSHKFPLPVPILETVVPLNVSDLLRKLRRKGLLNNCECPVVIRSFVCRRIRRTGGNSSHMNSGHLKCILTETQQIVLDVGGLFSSSLTAELAMKSEGCRVQDPRFDRTKDEYIRK